MASVRNWLDFTNGWNYWDLASAVLRQGPNFDRDRQQLDIAAGDHQPKQKRRRLPHRQFVSRGDDEAGLEQQDGQPDVAHIDCGAARIDAEPDQEEDSGEAENGRGRNDHAPDERRSAIPADRQLGQQGQPKSDRRDEIIGLHRVEVGILRREGRGHCDEHRLEQVGDEKDGWRRAFEIERDEARRRQAKGDRQGLADLMQQNGRAGDCEGEARQKGQIRQVSAEAFALLQPTVHPHSDPVMKRCAASPLPRRGPKGSSSN
jgi:hypothetical protein